MTKSTIDALRAELRRLIQGQRLLVDERATSNEERARTRPSRSGQRRHARRLESLDCGPAPVARRAERQPGPPRGLAAKSLKIKTHLSLVDQLLMREDEIAHHGLEAVVEELRDVGLPRGTDEATKAAQDIGVSILDELLVQLATKEKRDRGSAVEPWLEEVVRAELSFGAGLLREGLSELRRRRSGSEHIKYFLDRDGAELGVLERFLGAHSLTSRKTFIRYTELVALEASAPRTAHDGAFYREAWRAAVERLSTRILARYQG